VVLLGLVLLGCGRHDPGDPERPARSPADVAEDDDASAAEIVAAGHPVDADSADDGSRLVLYRVVGETGDVEQTAWRLYGADGDPVAEGKAGSTVLGLGDGFWVGDLVVGVDGTTREPSTASEALAPRPGDLIVRDFEELRALRPDPLTVFSARPAPRGSGQGWALDSQGRQWYQRVDPDEVLLSKGPAWEPVRAVPLSPGQHLLGFGITPVGDHVVLPVVRSTGGEQIAVDAIAVRRADAPPAAAWTLLGAGPLESEARYTFARGFALGDRHYVFSDLQGPPYVLDVHFRRWRRLPLPTDEQGWTLEPGRDGLYAFPPSADGTGTDAWFSTDLGATWEHLPH
jgi:hypothetical protein